MTKEQETAMIRGVWIGALGTAAVYCLWLFLSSVAFAQEPAPAEPQAQTQEFTPEQQEAYTRAWIGQVIKTHPASTMAEEGRKQCLGKGIDMPLDLCWVYTAPVAAEEATNEATP